MECSPSPGYDRYVAKSKPKPKKKYKRRSKFLMKQIENLTKIEVFQINEKTIQITI